MSRREALDTDEAMARAALHEAVKIALAPGNKRTKMAALKVVLDSKPKPGNASWSLAERRAIRAEGDEGWLQAVLDAPLITPEGQP